MKQQKHIGPAREFLEKLEDCGRWSLMFISRCYKTHGHIGFVSMVVKTHRNDRANCGKSKVCPTWKL